MKARKRSTKKRAQTLAEALATLKADLTAAGNPEYAALLSEPRVRAAIRAAIASYDVVTDDDEERRFPGSKEYWHLLIKPLCLRVAEGAEWPEECSFTALHTLHDRHGDTRITSEGFGLRLAIDTPGARFEGFALPIADVWFGRVEG